jgi:hypothetical protein
VSEEVKLILAFVEKRMSINKEALNKGQVITDGDTNITDNLRGRNAAYAAVKSFIDRGMRVV